MLDSCLESNIQKKLHIFSAFQLKNPISLKEISEMTKISPTSLTALIDELSFDLQGLADIKRNSPDLEMNIYEGISSFDIFHVIYQNSNILHCLRFMINNDKNIPFSEFAEEFFLTRPSAYRIRQNCVNYLSSIGLSVEKNKVVGEEYRIRFLIALLYYKYGIDCCGIDEESILIAREFVVATNDKIDLKFLDYTASEYGFFECLLILSWKRKAYLTDFSCSEELEPLKPMFIYPKLKQYLRATVEKRLNLTFSDADYNYIFLCYCSTNSCVLADKWTLKDITAVSSFVTAIPKFHDLILRFSNSLNTSIWQSRAFRTIMVYFFRKCLMNLQCIIPDKHYYIDIENDPFKRWIYNYVSNTLLEWKDENHIPYHIDKGHIQYLTIQIASTVQQFIDPVQVLVISDLISEIEVLSLYLSKAYSNRIITLRPVLLNAENLAFLSNLQNCVLITKKVFAPVLKDMHISNSNALVPINIEINGLDKSAIRNAIISCGHRKAQEMIFSPSKSSLS